MRIKCPWCPHAVDDHRDSCTRCDCEAQLTESDAQLIDGVEKDWQEVGKPLWEGLRARFPVDMEGK